ncbi:hypothetical protein [Arthrobacter pigmenti]
MDVPTPRTTKVTSSTTHGAPVAMMNADAARPAGRSSHFWPNITG